LSPSSIEGLGPRRLVAALFGTLKLMQMYGGRHDATADALQNLADAVHEAADGEPEAVVAVRGSRVQINGRTMRAAECGSLALAYIAKEFGRRAIAGLHLRHDITAPALGNFIGKFLELELAEARPNEVLVAALTGPDTSGISITPREANEPDPILLDDLGAKAMRTYLQGLRAFKDVLRYDGFKDQRKIRRARRAVQGLVDRFLEDEATVLALAQIRGHDLKLFHHCLNVSLYALAIGQRLGMSRRQLGELGIAALFHDIGKTAKHDKIPLEQVQREAPVRGARMLMEENSHHESMLKAAIVAFEQHSHYDGSGHPQVDHELHLFSRIITIADCFEALTAQRAPGEEHHSSYEAYLLMQQRAGTIFDPLLIKVFMNALGIYPVGSYVRLESGEVAMVQNAPAEPDNIDRPIVRVIKTGQGSMQPDETVDLAEPGEDGEPRNRIFCTLQPHEIFASVGEQVASLGF